MRRTLHEHKIVWMMLKTIPDLTSQLTDEDLKALSKSVTSETWVKGSTGNQLIWRDTWQDKIHVTVIIIVIISLDVKNPLLRVISLVSL